MVSEESLREPVISLFFLRNIQKNHIDYIELTGEYSIYEIPIPITWAGKTLLELEVRRKHHINIIAIKSESGLNPSPGADYVFKPLDHIIVIGKSNDVFKLSGKPKRQTRASAKKRTE